MEIVAAEGHARCFFGTAAPASGVQVWDTIEWPMDWQDMTERQVLDELYDAVLQLLEVRA